MVSFRRLEEDISASAGGSSGPGPGPGVDGDGATFTQRNHEAIYREENPLTSTVAIHGRAAAVRRSSRSAQTATVQEYQTWKGKHKFFMKGKFVYCKHSKNVLFTLVLSSLAIGLFVGFVCTWYGKISRSIFMAVSILLYLGILVSALLTAFTDPGLLPRKETNDFLDNIVYNEGTEMTSALRARLAKYCRICHLEQSPGTQHCRHCDSCIEEFDHHCPWAGNCIGRRNYRCFILLLFFVSVSACFIVVVSSVRVANVAIGTTQSFWRVLWDNPIDVALVASMFMTLLTIGGFLCFHCYLLCQGWTTNEYIRTKLRPNRQPTINIEEQVLQKGCIRNVQRVFCAVNPSILTNPRASGNDQA